jgi:hypothetical protein
MRERSGVRPSLQPVASQPRTRAEEEKERDKQAEHDENHRQRISLPR